VGWGLSLFLGVTLLSGCSTPADVAHGPSASPTIGVSTPAPSAAGAAAIVPGGSAQENFAVFRSVTERVWASRDRASGRAYIDALVKAGFAKSAMQVTNDRSTVGNPAESIQFSVRWKDGRCLVGQVGPATGDPVTVVVSGLPGGKCLIGDTRPINW
jgi:hypothetical protein